MTVYEYLTLPTTDTRHLVRQDDLEGRHFRTLCGRDARTGTTGDETMSGVAATCRRCRQLALPKNPLQVPGSPEWAAAMDEVLS